MLDRFRKTLLARGLLVSVLVAIAITQPLSAKRPSPTTKAAECVRQFYSTYIANKPAGLPSGSDLERLRPFLSTRLHGLIVAALQYQESWIAQHPPIPSPDGGPPIIDKPPFVDGDYFSSLFEGPRRFKVVRTVSGPVATWKVTVHFWYEPHDPGWEDTVVVVEERGRYVIDDVLFAGAGDFNPSGRLSDSLKTRED